MFFNYAIIILGHIQANRSTFGMARAGKNIEPS
jgi:hypothetical protein